MGKIVNVILYFFILASLTLLCTGCATNGGSAGSQQPGPAAFTGAEDEVYSQESGASRPPWYR
jgi:hypothetical protein